MWTNVDDRDNGGYMGAKPTPKEDRGAGNSVGLRLAAAVGPPVRTMAPAAQGQRFDGAFINNQATVSILLSGKMAPAVPKSLDQTSLGVEGKMKVWVTILAPAVLELNSGRKKSVCHGVVSQRKRWNLHAVCHLTKV
jgi:hypothetical protein